MSMNLIFKCSEYTGRKLKLILLKFSILLLEKFIYFGRNKITQALSENCNGNKRDFTRCHAKSLMKIWGTGFIKRLF